MPPEAAATSQAAPAFNDPNAEPQANSGQQALADSWSSGFLAKDGSFDHKAFDKAPDDLKPLAKDIGRYKGLDDLLRAFKERGELAGKKGLLEPLDPKTATDKDRTERLEMIRKVNGTPAKPEEFGLVRPETVPEAYWSQPAVDGIAKIMQEEGASPALAKRLFEASMTDLQGRLAGAQKEQEAILQEQDRLIRETLVKEGFDFPKGMEDAQRACRKFGLDPASPFLKNASIFMALSRVGRSVKEDTLITGATDGLGGGANLTNDQAKAQAESITHDPKNPLYQVYWNKDEKGRPTQHKDHDKVVSRVNELWAMAVKGKPDRQRQTR